MNIRPQRPPRGVPQGGVLSPPLWLLHVNGAMEGALRRLKKKTDRHGEESRALIQMFAGSRKNKTEIYKVDAMLLNRTA